MFRSPLRFVFLDNLDYGNPARPWWILRGPDVWRLNYWQRHDVVPAKRSKRY